jgi:hypothetical protein
LPLSSLSIIIYLFHILIHFTLLLSSPLSHIQSACQSILYLLIPPIQSHIIQITQSLFPNIYHYLLLSLILFLFLSHSSFSNLLILFYSFSLISLYALPSLHLLLIIIFHHSILFISSLLLFFIS